MRRYVSCLSCDFFALAVCRTTYNVDGIYKVLINDGKKLSALDLTHRSHTWKKLIIVLMKVDRLERGNKGKPGYM